MNDGFRQDTNARVRSFVWLSAAMIFAALLLTYFGSLGNDPVWDDKYLITENPFLRSLEGLRTILSSDLWTASGKEEPSSFYRPLTMTTYWLNGLLGGYSAASIRLINVLLHAANVLLLLLLIRRLDSRVSDPTLTLFMLLLGVSPLCSEPVLWLSGRFDLLVGAFALLTLLANRSEGWRSSLGVVLAVAGGLFSKENFLGWLPLLLVDDLILLSRPLRRIWPKYFAVALTVVAYLAVRAHLHLPSASILEDHNPYALLVAYLFAVRTFVPLLFVPIGLDPFHPYVTLPAWQYVLVAFLLVSISIALGLGCLHWRRRFDLRIALVGWLWFLLALLPSAMTGPTLMMIGDRYAYLPVLGLFLAAWVAVAAGSRWLTTHLPPRKATLLVTLTLVPLCLASAWATIRRSQDWQNDRSLAEASLRADPDNFYALYSLGAMEAQEDNLEEAQAHLTRSLEENDSSWRTWNAVCYVLFKQHHLEEARQACLRSAGINAGNPRVWVNLASIYVTSGQWRYAYEAAAKAVQLKPAYAEARYLAAVSAANLGQLEVAREHLRVGLSLEPNHARLKDLKHQLELAEVDSPVRKSDSAGEAVKGNGGGTSDKDKNTETPALVTPAPATPVDTE